MADTFPCHPIPAVAAQIEADAAAPPPVRHWVVLFSDLPVVIVGPFASAGMAANYGRGFQHGAGDNPCWQALCGEDAEARARRLTPDGRETA